MASSIEDHKGVTVLKNFITVSDIKNTRKWIHTMAPNFSFGEKKSKEPTKKKKIPSVHKIYQLQFPLQYDKIEALVDKFPYLTEVEARIATPFKKVTCHQWTGTSSDMPEVNDYSLKAILVLGPSHWIYEWSTRKEKLVNQLLEPGTLIVLKDGAADRLTFGFSKKSKCVYGLTNAKLTRFDSFQHSQILFY